MTSGYAENTQVPVAKTRQELEALLEKHGAVATAVFNSPGAAAIAFELGGRQIKMAMALPNPEDRAFTHAIRRKNQHDAGTPVRLPPDEVRKRYEQACRAKWRALLLAVKAKLVSVGDGIETFEEAFMAHVVLPDGRTIAETIKPQIALAYKERRVVPLLSAPPP